MIMNWIMDPVFSPQFIEKVQVLLGDWGIVLLGLMKMAIMFIGMSLLVSPLVLVGLFIINHLLPEPKKAKHHIPEKLKLANHR